MAYDLPKHRSAHIRVDTCTFDIRPESKNQSLIHDQSPGVGQLVWGLAGIILTIPLTAMFKIVCDHIESLKPYGFWVGEIEAAVEEPGYITKIKGWFTKKPHK